MLLTLLIACKPPPPAPEGLDEDGTVSCWGSNEDDQATPPEQTFSSIDGGWRHGCGLTTEGDIACWGYNKYDQAQPPAER